jgi:hypothetical protein
MWDDRDIEVWDARLVFVLAALFSISIWIVIAKRREAIKTGRTPWLAYSLLIVFMTVFALTLLGRSVHYWGYPYSQYPNPGAVLAFLIGSVVGSFSARFVWSLFGARFGAKDPLIGVLALLILVIIYSLPVYQRGISGFFGHIGVSSLKTPIAELTFAEGISRFAGLGRLQLACVKL